MKDLVFLQHRQALTTSLKVAEYFGKRHNDVLRAISASNQALRNFAGSENAFIKSSYKDETGKSNPMYLLNPYVLAQPRRFYVRGNGLYRRKSRSAEVELHSTLKETS